MKLLFIIMLWCISGFHTPCCPQKPDVQKAEPTSSVQIVPSLLLTY